MSEEERGKRYERLKKRKKGSKWMGRNSCTENDEQSEEVKESEV